MQSGDVVKLKYGVIVGNVPEGREDNDTAIIWSVGDQGEVFLNRDLHGMRYWHVDDLERR